GRAGPAASAEWTMIAPECGHLARLRPERPLISAISAPSSPDGKWRGGAAYAGIGARWACGSASDPAVFLQGHISRGLARRPRRSLVLCSAERAGAIRSRAAHIGAVSCGSVTLGAGQMINM